MLLRGTVMLCALGAAVIARADDVRQVTLTDLKPGSNFEISTADRVYRGEMVDPTTGEARLAVSLDGVQFSQPQTVFLLGATQGRAAEAGGQMLVKMNQLQSGLRVELGFGSLDESNRYVTAPVRAIRVD